MTDDIQMGVTLTTEEAVKKAKELSKQLDEVFAANRDKDTSESPVPVGLTEAYANIQKLLDKINEFNTAGSMVPTEKYKELNAELIRLDAKYRDIQEKIWSIEESGGRQGRYYNSLQAQLQEVDTASKQVVSDMHALKASNKAFEPDPSAKETLNGYTEELGEAVNEASRLMQTMQGVGAVTNSTAFPEAKANAFGSSMQRVNSILETVANGALKFLQSGLESAASSAKRLISNLGQLAGSTIQRGINSLASSIFGLKRNTDDTSKSVKKGIKLFIRYAFGVRSFFFLYRRVRKAVVEGFENMAQFSGPLNNKISQIITSFNYLKTSLTTAFAPIVNFVAPAVTLLMDKLAQATTAIGKFFAALLGQTSFVQAKKVYQDYAKSLDKSTKKRHKDAKETKKKIDKLHRTIAGFDDVEILKGPNEYETIKTPEQEKEIWPWENPKNMFETVGIEAKFKKLADKIKGFFKKKDWEGLGKFIANGINSLFKKIDKTITSSKLQNKVKTVVDAITGTFNSLVDNIKWKLIGKTFGDGINLIIGTLNRLLTGINWEKFGTKIAEGLNSLIDTIHWPAIGQYFANRFNAIIGTLYGIIANFHWDDLGKDLGDAINGFFFRVKWKELALTFSKLINGVFSALYNLTTTVKWTEMSAKFTEALNLFVSQVKWKDVGKTIGQLFKDSLDALSTTLDTFDWENLGTSIGDCLVNMDWPGIITRLYFTIIGAAAAAGDLLYSMLGTIIGSAFKWAFEHAADVIEKEGIPAVYAGIFDGIANFEFDWVDLIYEHIYKPFIKAFAKAFGISNKVSEKMKYYGKAIIQGFIRGMIEDIPVIGQALKMSRLVSTVITVIKQLFGIASPAKVMMPLGKNILDGLLAGVTNNLSSIFPWAKSNVVSSVINAFKSGFGISGNIANAIKFVGEGIINGVKSGVSGKWPNLSTYLGKVKTSIFNALNKGRQWLNIGAQIINGIKSGISNRMGSLLTTVRNMATRAYNAVARTLGIRSPSRVFRDKIGKMIPAGMAIGIDKSASSALKSAEQLANNVVDAATQAVQLPPIVGGQVIPYSVGKADTNDTNNALNQLLSMLQYNRGNDVTLDTLETLLVTMFRQYMNIQFYMGDEQVARHANAGNAKLERRYNPSML